MKVQVFGMALVMLCAVSTCVFGQALIIDHTCTDISRVPPQAITKAKATLTVAYGHTSHGSQIVSGMGALSKADPGQFFFTSGPVSGDGKALSFLDHAMPGDLGGNWAHATREYLNGAGKKKKVNVIMWSWCGQVSGSSEKDIEKYLTQMSDLEKDFPNVKFVYMTGHLDGTGANGNLNKRNEQIREFCRKNGKVLFDFADIESYDPDGKVNYMNLGATDACDYKRGGATKNWADEWLAKNPGKTVLPDSAAHSRPLNGALKGRAFWWMAARMSGWNPQGT